MCFCGDLCCPSCGPAQGNARCPACRAWASEGCECTAEQIETAERTEREADRHYAEQMAEWDRQEQE